MSKIVLIGPVFPFRGGIAHHTTHLARALGRDHQVLVVSFQRQYPTWLYPGKSDRDPSQQPLPAPAEFLLAPLNPFSWLRTLRRLVNYEPDLVIFQWWVTFWSPAFTCLAWGCRQQKLPVAYLVHNVLPHEGSWIHRPLARMALSQSRRHIVQTPAEANRLKRLVPGSMPVISPHPVYDQLTPKRPVEQNTARNAYNIPPGAIVLLFFGIVRPYKGLPVLIDALARLVGDANYHLIIAGEFWEPLDRYQIQIQRLNLEQNIHIEPRYIPNEELPQLFAAADIAVAPYTAGTQSGFAALSIGYNLPLVLTHRSAAGVDNEYLQDAEIANPGDSDDLAQAIRRQAARLGQPRNQRDDTKTGNSWAAMIKVIESLIPEKKGSE